MKARPSFEKRRKEMARQEKQREKVARRVQRKDDRPEGGSGASEDDPDLAGIVCGPQPVTRYDDNGFEIVDDDDEEEAGANG